jgi:hypothetical protein
VRKRERARNRKSERLSERERGSGNVCGTLQTSGRPVDSKTNGENIEKGKTSTTTKNVFYKQTNEIRDKQNMDERERDDVQVSA